jgi:hypothetical protein
MVTYSFLGMTITGEAIAFFLIFSMFATAFRLLYLVVVSMRKTIYWWIEQFAWAGIQLGGFVASFLTVWYLFDFTIGSYKVAQFVAMPAAIGGAFLVTLLVNRILSKRSTF